MRYTHKPTEVDAISVAEILTMAKGSWGQLPDWFRRHYHNGNIVMENDAVNIHSFGANVRATGDFMIVRDIERGNIYPVAGSVFHELYEPVKQ